MMDSFKSYCSSISKYPLLSKSEEKELLLRASSGDEEAREQLITSNQRLVISIAKKYVGHGVDIMELIQQGNIGLMYSIDHYNTELNTALSTFATIGIKKFITKYLTEQSRIVRKPQWQQEMTVKIIEAQQSLQEELGRTPTDEEIATRVGISSETVYRISKDNASSIVSLDTPLDDEGHTVLDTIAAENEEYSREKLKRVVAIALEYLNEDDKKLLSQIYGVNGYSEKSLAELGREYNVSREAVRKAKEDALRKLRHPDILKRIRGEL